MKPYIYEHDGTSRKQRAPGDAAESDFAGVASLSYEVKSEGTCGVYRFRSEKIGPFEVIMSGGRLKEGQSFRTWTCTRSEDHEGHHVAHDNDGTVVARWERESPAREKAEMARCAKEYHRIFPRSEVN